MKTAQEVLSKYCGLSDEDRMWLSVIQAMEEYTDQFRPTHVKLNNKFHNEKIKCPECGRVQFAKVEHTFPFYTYIHTCKKCSHVIMESEWIMLSKGTIQ